MELLFPSKGAHLPSSHPVVFSGTAASPVVRVRLVADERFPIGESKVTEGRWTVARIFAAPGVRKIRVDGLSASGKAVQSFSFSITLVEPHTLGYTPPTGTATHLGAIAFELEIAERLSPDFAGLEAMFVLPEKQLYVESDLDLDTDGERDPGVIYETTHQDRTTLRLADGRFLNSNTVPYFVLPGLEFDGHSVTVEGIKVQLGDIAAILYKTKLEFAVFADTGPVKGPHVPKTKIGEGSIALHRSLGFERIRADKHIRDSGIDNDVVTLIFPGSGDGTAQTPDAIRTKGRALFTALGGTL